MLNWSFFVSFAEKINYLLAGSGFRTIVCHVIRAFRNGEIEISFFNSWFGYLGDKTHLKSINLSHFLNLFFPKARNCSSYIIDRFHVNFQWSFIKHSNVYFPTNHQTNKKIAIKPIWPSIKSLSEIFFSNFVHNTSLLCHNPIIQ